MLTSKHPSPKTNPAIQFGSGMLVVFISGLSTGIIRVKSDFKFSEIPKFKEALILTMFCKPSIVR